MTPLQNFDPIASRQLLLVLPGDDVMPVHVAVSAPYASATAEEMGCRAACLVWTCDELTLPTEVYGADEMEALMVALDFIESFLRELTHAGRGQLKTFDGRPFDPEGSPLFRELKKRINSG